MPDFKHKEGSFSIFRNEDKEGNQPDYKGKGTLNGQEVRLACWLKESQNGKKFFSGKFEVQEPMIKEINEHVEKSLGETLDDEIPF